jgi:ATP-dependent DNA helicase RecQ
LLYLAPERVVQSATQQLLRSLELSIIAIDEAHCVSQWGHDFRQDYLALDALGSLFPGVPRMALTATATPETRDDIVQRLGLANPAILVGGFDRPNIRYAVQPKTDGRRQLRSFLAGRRGQSGIVYCLSRRKVETTVDFLRRDGLEALPYHAGLSGTVRAENQRRFQTEDGLIVVATIAFGMGIDKPDVRFVAHLDLPKSLESYYQETGRAGRDGTPADAWMIYGLQDVVRLRQMADESAADEQHKRTERRGAPDRRPPRQTHGQGRAAPPRSVERFRHRQRARRAGLALRRPAAHRAGALESRSGTFRGAGAHAIEPRRPAGHRDRAAA